MGSVTSVEFSLRWAHPVYVGTSDNLDTMIEGPAAAIRWMSANFTQRNGPGYWRAHSLCRSAILGYVHPDFARQPFVDAWVGQCSNDADEG